MLLVLAGCQLMPSFGSKKEAAAPGEACPPAVILRPLANTAVFGPAPKRAPDNVAFYGLLSDVSLKCERAGDTLRLKLDVVVIGERGLVPRGNVVDLNYFVAVVGPGQTILSKRPFAVRIDLGNAKRAGVTDHIEEAIALGGRRPTDLSIDLGFQQGPDVIEFYKHFRGR
ncbi:MAG TPA: hypothetical protein VFA12_16215 [Stellaceae bacterium]|nr:hypothetical protein [Stellaceae bacterium]